MPKTTQGRTMDAEDQLARRVEFERERAGLSYQALAQAMTEVGCKIHATALHKIEKGDKQTGRLRRVTVNELTALAQVLTNGDVSELLRSVDDVELEQGQELVEEYRACVTALGDLSTRMFNATLRLMAMTDKHPHLAEYVRNFMRSAGLGRYTLDTPDTYGPVSELALLRIISENQDWLRNSMEAAALVHAHRTGQWTKHDDEGVAEELRGLREAVAGEGITVEQDPEEDGA